jgi:glycosyltransferase involved in cell wall biosynthesis
LGLGERVTFAPYLHDRDELARAYAGASCVVLPGAHETFGLAALEAAACGAPVVTADSTPSARLLRGSVQTFRAGDAPDLLLAIERARKRTPDPVAAAMIAARHRWDAALAAELADLKSLLGMK